MSEPSARPPRWVWVSIAICVLTLINMSMADDDAALALAETSYGQIPDGYGAVYDLLSELDGRSGRSRAAYASLPVDRTLWLLAPAFLRDDDDDVPGPLRADGSLASELDAWITRGGTAVVFGKPYSDWSHYGLAVTPDVDDDSGDHEHDDEAGAEHDAHASAKKKPHPQVIRTPHVSLPSTLAPQLRALELDGLRSFEPALAPGFERVLGTATAPFAARMHKGKGTLIVVADVRPLANAALDKADHANLAVDLARAFGTPLFDERCHGLLPDRTLFSALGRSRVLLLAFGLGLCLLLALWHLRSVPASSIARLPGLDPGLESFVASLSLLYSRKAPRDVAAVYRAYLHGVRFRMRQLLYGARGGSDEQLGQRLQRDFAADPELLARLRGERVPKNERELQATARALEGAVASLSARRALQYGRPTVGLRPHERAGARN